MSDNLRPPKWEQPDLTDRPAGAQAYPDSYGQARHERCAPSYPGQPDTWPTTCHPYCWPTCRPIPHRYHRVGDSRHLFACSSSPCCPLYRYPGLPPR